MATVAKRWTVDMLRALPDDRNRYEIIDGELFVTPAPSLYHQRAVLRLALQIVPYLETRRIGEAVIAPADVEFSDDTVVEPDLFAMPLVTEPRPRSWREVGRLFLAVEVLSPSTARADRIRKRALYARERVPEYWIVDVDARLVERWRPDDERPEILSERIAWQPDPTHPALEIDLARYFAEILDE